MKKRIPAEAQSSDVISKEDFDNRIDSLFKSIYSEKPEFWKNGLNRGLYNGLGDEIILLSDKDKDYGFLGLQRYRKSNSGELGTGISIGLIPEYRGKGIAKKMLLKIIPQKINPEDGNIIWACHKDNLASQALCKALMREKELIPNKIILQQEDN